MVSGRDNHACYSADGLDRFDMALQSAVITLYALQAAMMTLLEYCIGKDSAQDSLGRLAVGNQWKHQCQRALKMKSNH